ncbi:MAG: alkaline phosphatase family protein [Verrucomicrobiota bacterium]
MIRVPAAALRPTLFDCLVVLAGKIRPSRHTHSCLGPSRLRLAGTGSLLLITLLFCIASWPGAFGADAAHVVLITIDGFPARMFTKTNCPVPHLQALAAAGAMAEGLKVSNPTVTWPNHTTLVTGVTPAKHSVLYNGRLVHGGPGLPVRIEPKCDQAELVAVPTVYDVFHRAGLRTAAINWPCTRNAGTIDDNFPDVPEMVRHTTPNLRRELVAAGALVDETDASFAALTGPGRDEVWIQAACHVIRERRPAFLMLHLLNTDGIHHRYGPESPASYTALALADSYVGRLLDSLDAAGIRKETTVFVVSDHGFATATNLLQPNVLLRQAGLLELGASNQVAKARAQVVPEGGIGMIYFPDPKSRERDRQQVIELFRARPEIADVIGRESFGAMGLPQPGEHPGMAELILVPHKGFGVGGAATGDQFVVPITGTISQGYHGYVATEPAMDGLFIAAGRGIKQTKLGMVDNVDVAPTIARLLDQTLPGILGKPLDSILVR